MAEQEELYEKSWILYHVLDSFIGNREIVAVRRRMELLREGVTNCNKTPVKRFNSGSLAEGFAMKGSDRDWMLRDSNVLVLCPDQETSIPPKTLNKTVLVMRDAHSRPGYVKLELVNMDQTCLTYLKKSIVPVGDVYFISSEICRQSIANIFGTSVHADIDMNGPASTILDDHCNLGIDQDCVISLPCKSWPRKANEWVSRLRLDEWPSISLRDEIVKGGCHLVPVGDKTSCDTFLQWRISFATAERKLVHSFNHSQFLVYGLLKYFLKQISRILKNILGDVDIISSYIIKTAIFYSVENTPQSLWQEKNTFLCFMLCLKILMTWVNAGYCPNYFIKRNNMFLGKLHGGNKGQLLQCLGELYNMTWKCLSVGTFIQPSIGQRIESVQNGDWEYVLPKPAQLESQSDLKIFTTASALAPSSDAIPLTLELLSKSKSDLDEFVAYLSTVNILTCTGIENFQKYISSRGNKEKYKSLGKCKNLLNPLATTCTSPGLLMLATYHYQTGNYKKTLEICEHMISSWKIYVGDGTVCKNKDRYEYLFCGRGYTLLQKCHKACVSLVRLDKNCIHFCPTQLHMELERTDGPSSPLCIPPLPYAVFLSFLCYHTLGHIRRRDAVLNHLRSVKYDEDQGSGKYWIVHNLLGICFEMVGDTQRALREYRDSLGGQRPLQFENPAKERIERL